jgi:hypothetical protein
MKTSTRPTLKARENNAMPTSSGRFHMGLVSLALVGLLFAAALPSSAQKEGFEEPPPKGGLLVTYLVFSGLPNPTVTLTDPEQVADLQRRLTSTVESGTRIDGEGPEPVLGYNGIMIEDLATSEEEDSTFYVVKDDVLRVDGGNPEDPAARSTTIAGEAAEIENLLISLGVESGAIDEATLAEIRDPK